MLAKTPEPSARAPLESIKTTSPMELVCLDFWTAEDRNKRSVDVLVVTDHFTKMAHAFPCRNQTAKQIAKQLWDRVFCVYGFPERIHSDQGPGFESDLVYELLQLSGVAKSRTTAYHPMGNGGTERFNRTLGNMLRALPLGAKNDWPQQIHTLTFAYNATVHETTGYAPFYLMFGRVPRLPVDIVFKSVLRDPLVTDFSSYARTLLSYLAEGAKIAQQHANKAQEHQAHQYNRKAKGLALHIGDRVLLANKGERGKKKLADKWESAVYTVVETNPKSHIYKISDVAGHCKVVHRNLLLDVNFLPVQDDQETLNVSSEADGLSGGSEVDEFDSLEKESSQTRTSLWVQSEVGRSDDDIFVADEGVSQDFDDGNAQRDGADEADNVLVDADIPQFVTNATSEQPDSPTRTAQAPRGSSVGSEEAQSVKMVVPDTHHIQNHDDLHTDKQLGFSRCAADRARVPGRVVTRAGRVVRSVNRLIENMVQRPFTWHRVSPQKALSA